MNSIREFLNVLVGQLTIVPTQRITILKQGKTLGLTDHQEAPSVAPFKLSNFNRDTTHDDDDQCSKIHLPPKRLGEPPRHLAPRHSRQGGQLGTALMQCGQGWKNALRQGQK
ncbi:hypothetical protein AMTR_s00025p00101140 [Amborella trichopoda]|uniref:Uncharacterized protein n=1 Tax=Amborella trichopoda TaxID=13333 RepID=W1PY21_AMBTC|nr:hypothetical protein AMTR_s00025p00101140 [Amborella trichopoda]